MASMKLSLPQYKLQHPFSSDYTQPASSTASAPFTPFTNSQAPSVPKSAVSGSASKSQPKNKPTSQSSTHTKNTAKSCAWAPTIYQSYTPRPSKRFITHASKPPFTTSIIRLHLFKTHAIKHYTIGIGGYGVWHLPSPNYAVMSRG